MHRRPVAGGPSFAALLGPLATRDWPATIPRFWRRVLFQRSAILDPSARIVTRPTPDSTVPANGTVRRNHGQVLASVGSSIIDTRGMSIYTPVDSGAGITQRRLGEPSARRQPEIPGRPGWTPAEGDRVERAMGGGGGAAHARLRAGPWVEKWSDRSLRGTFADLGSQSGPWNPARRPWLPAVHCTNQPRVSTQRALPRHASPSMSCRRVGLALAPRKVIRRRNQVALAILWPVAVYTAHLTERNVGAASSTACCARKGTEGARNHFRLSSSSSLAGRTNIPAQHALALRSCGQAIVHFTPSLRLSECGLVIHHHANTDTSLQPQSAAPAMHLHCVVYRRRLELIYPITPQCPERHYKQDDRLLHEVLGDPVRLERMDAVEANRWEASTRCT